MPDAQSYNDHDLLVSINTKMDIWIPEVIDLKGRVTALERILDRQAGFLSGGKALAGFITAMPAGAIGVLLGKYAGL